MMRNLVICFVLLKSRMLVRYERNLLDGGFGDVEVGCFYIWELGIDGYIIGWKCGWFESLVCGDIGLDLLLWMGWFWVFVAIFCFEKIFLIFQVSIQNNLILQNCLFSMLLPVLCTPRFNFLKIDILRSFLILTIRKQQKNMLFWFWATAQHWLSLVSFSYFSSK